MPGNGFDASYMGKGLVLEEAFWEASKPGNSEFETW